MPTKTFTMFLKISLMLWKGDVALILLSFSPLSWAFIPSHIHKKRQNHMNSNHGNNSSIKIAVPIGHSKGTFKDVRFGCEIQANWHSYH